MLQQVQNSERGKKIQYTMNMLLDKKHFENGKTFVKERFVMYSATDRGEKKIL